MLSMRCMSLLWLAAAALGCQYDHIPLFDERTRSFIRCDIWRPQCPPQGECEVAGREVRGKLGLRSDQADFLCCIDPRSLHDVTHSPLERPAPATPPCQRGCRRARDPSTPFSNAIQPRSLSATFPPIRPFPVHEAVDGRPSPPGLLSRISDRLKLSRGSPVDSWRTGLPPTFSAATPRPPPSFLNRLATLGPRPAASEGWGPRLATTTPYSHIYTFPSTPVGLAWTPTPPPPAAFAWGLGAFRRAKGDEPDFPTPLPFLQRLEEKLKISGGLATVEGKEGPKRPSLLNGRTTRPPTFDVWGRRINADGSVVLAVTEEPKGGDAIPPGLVPLSQKKGPVDTSGQNEVSPMGSADRVFPWDVKLPPGQDPQHYMPTTSTLPPTTRAPPTTTPKAPTTPVMPPAAPVAQPPAVTLTPIMPAMAPGQQNTYGSVTTSDPSPRVLPIVVGDASAPTSDGVYKWSGSVTLVQDDGYNILVDSGTAANRQALIGGLASHGLRPENVQILVLTHGHPDHIGNDNLFPLAVKLFNNLLYKGNDIMESRQMKGDVFQLTKNVEVWKTGGHTQQHNSAVVRNVRGFGSVAVSGDLFISADDLVDPSIWSARSLDSKTQSRNRLKILCQVDVIVPGHGPMYRLTPQFKDQQCARKTAA